MSEGYRTRRIRLEDLDGAAVMVKDYLNGRPVYYASVLSEKLRRMLENNSNLKVVFYTDSGARERVSYLAQLCNMHSLDLEIENPRIGSPEYLEFVVIWHLLRDSLGRQITRNIND